jgi:hypothetical protein
VYYLKETLYKCEMALNFGVDVSFDKMMDWKGIRGKLGKVNSARVFRSSVTLFRNSTRIRFSTTQLP